MGTENRAAYVPIFDEARFRAPEDHRAIDHAFEHDANEEVHYLFGTEQKRVRFSWSWLWTSLEFGIGWDFYARKGAWKQEDGGILDVWLNLGLLTLMVELKGPEA